MKNIARSQVIRFTTGGFHYRAAFQSPNNGKIQVKDITYNPGGEGQQESVSIFTKEQMSSVVQSFIDFENEWQETARAQKIQGPIFLSATELKDTAYKVYDTPCYKDIMTELNVAIDDQGQAFNFKHSNISDDAEFTSLNTLNSTLTTQKNSQKITEMSQYFNGLAEKIATQHVEQELLNGRNIDDINISEFTDHITDLTVGIEDTLNMAMKYIGSDAAEILDINQRISEQLTDTALTTLHGKTAQLYLIEKMVEAGQQSYKGLVNGEYNQLAHLDDLKSAISLKLNSIDLGSEVTNCHDLMTTTQKITEKNFFVSRMQTAFENAIQAQKDANSTSGQKAQPVKPGAARRMKSMFSFGKTR